LEGYNVTIFAYGQTATGKTYTIQGPCFDNDHEENTEYELRGLMPRAFDYIFSKIKQARMESSFEKRIDYFVKASYLEIYNE
jgi:kinesin family protein 15